MGFFSKLKKGRKKTKAQEEQQQQQQQEQQQQGQEQQDVDHDMVQEHQDEPNALAVAEEAIPSAAPTAYDATESDPRSPIPSAVPLASDGGAERPAICSPPPPRPQRTTSGAGPARGLSVQGLGAGSVAADEIKERSDESYALQDEEENDLIDGVPAADVRDKLEKFYQMYEPSKLATMNAIMKYARDKGLTRVDQGLLQKYGCTTGLGGLEGVETMDTVGAPPPPPPPPTEQSSQKAPPPPPPVNSEASQDGPSLGLDTAPDQSELDAAESAGDAGFATQELSQEERKEEARLRDSIRLPLRPSLLVDEAPASPSNTSHVMYKSLRSALRARRLEDLHEDLLACGVEEYTDLAKLDTVNFRDEVWGQIGDYMVKKKLRNLANEAKEAAAAAQGQDQDGTEVVSAGVDSDTGETASAGAAEASAPAATSSGSSKRISMGSNSGNAAALAMAAVQQLNVRRAASAQDLDPGSDRESDRELTSGRNENEVNESEAEADVEAEKAEEPKSVVTKESSTSEGPPPPPPPPPKRASAKGSALRADEEPRDNLEAKGVAVPARKPSPPPPLPSRESSRRINSQDAEMVDGEEEEEDSVSSQDAPPPGPPPPLPSRRSSRRMETPSGGKDQEESNENVEMEVPAASVPPPPPPPPPATQESTSDVGEDNAAPRVEEEIVEISDEEDADESGVDSRYDDQGESEYEEGEVIYEGVEEPASKESHATTKGDGEDAATKEEEDAASAKVAQDMAAPDREADSVADGDTDDEAAEKEDEEQDEGQDAEMTEEEKREAERQERFARQEEIARREREAMAASASGGKVSDTASEADTILESDISPGSTPSGSSRKFMSKSGIPIVGANDEMRALLERRQQKNQEYPSEKTIMTESQVDEACDNFRLDMTAATFNTCVCGYPKSEHSSKNSARSSPAGSFRSSGSNRFSQRFANFVPPQPGGAPTLPGRKKPEASETSSSTQQEADAATESAAPAPAPAPPIPSSRPQSLRSTASAISAASSAHAKASDDEADQDGSVVEQVASETELDVGQIRAKVEAFYREHNPEKLDSMDKIMKTFAGREHVLLDKLEKKYGQSIIS
ncbi:Hypothetical Protein FCC1311_103192 [Hondaea fermentalgiana]|uniref:Uncharacterized protein n=1 Tax=Hondaea fermentalgiana TaxID=2315210 RepID=A0A2R5GTA0_9STRA|nr:Hypothetical Protein FCC1311_103192 [Hondaea fermentalgiana]|eukprot:GBG34096.1 Hypothetical Protein FCC1311_103192 [Hondaea fermentalgiana]